MPVLQEVLGNKERQGLAGAFQWLQTGRTDGEDHPSEVMPRV